MKSCCDKDCNQGRNCPARQACELPITMEEDAFNYDWVMDLLRDLLMVIGIFAIVTMIAFAYWSRT